MSYSAKTIRNIWQGAIMMFIIAWGIPYLFAAFYTVELDFRLWTTAIRGNCLIVTGVVLVIDALYVVVTLATAD